MSDVRKSFLLSFADSYLAIMLQLASTVIIARLLTPAEVGVFAIAAVFSALASTVRDFGMGEYLIQARELDNAKIRAAYGVNVVVSWTMAAALVLGAPATAAFYREPGVADVMRVLALSFVLVPFGAVVQYWFRRELNYRPNVIVNAFSSITVFIVSVGLAYRGHGHMRLAWSSVAGIAVTVLGAMYFRPPGFPVWPSLRGAAEVFRFGKYATGMYMLMQLGRGAPELVIGRVAGAAAVGIFSRANGLVELFRRLLLKPVMQVCLPYFARAEREQTGAITQAYLTSVGLLTAAGWPMLGLLGVLAYSAIRIVYGDQWMDAVVPAQVLCLACAVELMFFLSREALLALGAARRATLLQFQILGLQVLGLLAAVPYGLVGASWGLVAAAFGGLALSQWHLRRAFGLELGALLRACWPSFVLTIASVGPCFLLTQLRPVDEGSYVVVGAAGLLLTMVLWFTGLRLLKHPLWPEVTRIAGRLARRNPGPTA